MKLVGGGGVTSEISWGGGLLVKLVGGGGVTSEISWGGGLLVKLMKLEM